MKVIDLLNKIANGEEVPMVKYEDRILKYNELHEWFDDVNDDSRCKMEFYPSELNDEVEVIEEEKDIEELNLDTDELLKNVVITAQDYVIEGKINELIKAVNELKNK